MHFSGSVLHFTVENIKSKEEREKGKKKRYRKKKGKNSDSKISMCKLV